MSALTLLIIRHAEKPGGDWPGPGLTDAGVPDDKSLVVRGWQRAGAWAALFGGGRGGDALPTPAVIYAADPAAGEDAAISDGGPSKRPLETITPLCAALNLTPVTKWAQDSEAQLVQEITSLSGVVLVCWEHKRIVSAILPAIAAGADLGMPQKWNGDRFDVVLRLDRAAPNLGWTFQQLFPKLLSGDSDAPLGG